MEAAGHAHHHDQHHEMPTSGRALTSVAFSATLHCLTGCALGEITGMVISTAWGWSNGPSIAISVALAFLFGYTLTSLPLLRAGLAIAAVVPIALASDTLSIAIMELVDNGIMLLIPGAMHAGLGDVLFWGSLSFSLVVAGLAAVPANRWLIARGKGHAVVHETGIHGGPPVRLVAGAAAVAAVFGTTVLATQVVSGDGMSGRQEMGGDQAGGSPAGVRGLAISQDGMTLALGQTRAPRGRETALSFQVLGRDGRPMRAFEVEHEKRMHFIVVRRDLTGFQHLHPAMSPDGTWRTRLTIRQPGSYRLFADFKTRGRNETLAADLAVDGPVRWQEMPAPTATATTADGYDVRMAGTSAAGRESELGFTVVRGGRPVSVEPYLGAGGHLVALRQGDLAYLHVHPTGRADSRSGPVSFMTEFPTPGRYRLFLQFKHGGRVHTAAFTRQLEGTADQRSPDSGMADHQGAHDG
jgi:hypothetical protein